MEGTGAVAAIPLLDMALAGTRAAAPTRRGSRHISLWEVSHDDACSGGSASGRAPGQRNWRCAPQPRIYIATMEPSDEECLRRIDRHRQIRAGRGFVTVECYRDLRNLSIPTGARLCWVHGKSVRQRAVPAGDTPTSALEAVLQGADALRCQCRSTVVVSNEVFSAVNMARDAGVPTAAGRSADLAAGRTLSARCPAGFDLLQGGERC
ncbi:MAG: bifunctional adenosylcobinamide kinase/adenosylcobinamide-phosphate guanylyltransferase [Dysosmobacter welbionis]